jgi:hypothetical protein
LDVNGTSRAAIASLFLVMLTCLSFAQAPHSKYDPGAQNPSSKPKDGFIDYTLKRINPSDKDYGYCIDDGRKVLLADTIENGYFWSNLVALGLLGCLFIIIVYQQKQQTRNEWVTAETLAQSEHALARANTQVDEATKRNHGLMEALAAVKEAALRSQPLSTDPLDPAAVRAPRSRASNTLATPTAVPKNAATKPAIDQSTAVATAPEAGAQIGLFKPEVDLITKVNSLQQQLGRSKQLENELRRQLNEAGRKLQAEQEKNRSLKGE